MFEASSRQFMMKVVNMMIEKSIEIRGSETKANHSGLAGWRSRMELKVGARPSGSGASNGASSYRLARSVAGLRWLQCGRTARAVLNRIAA